MADYGFNTLAVHAGAPARSRHRGRGQPPSTRRLPSSSRMPTMPRRCSNLQVFGNIYSRIMNPTNAVLEERVAALENGRRAALSCGSGHAAQLLALHTLMGPGGQYRGGRASSMAARSTSSAQGFAKFELACEMGRCHQGPDSFKPDARTKADFLSKASPIPGGIITDIEAVAKIAHAAGVPADRGQHPGLALSDQGRLEWGADIVIHSATKFLGGHGNSMGRCDRGRRQVSTGAAGKFPSLSEALPVLSRP